VLGAVLGLTDPVAATAIAGRVGAPRRIVTVLEGESLVNDASALTAIRFAIAAVVTGTFSLVDAVGEFVLDVAGGLAIGLVVGVALAYVFRRIDDAPTEAAVQIVSPYFAYIGADVLGFSGVIAAVTGGLYLGWRSPELMSAQSRLQLTALWQILVFLLNSLLFVLVGLQLPSVIDALEEESALELVGYALVVALTVMAVRFLWVFPFTHGPRWLSRRIRERDPSPSWRGVTIVAFTGCGGRCRSPRRSPSPRRSRAARASRAVTSSSSSSTRPSSGRSSWRASPSPTSSARSACATRGRMPWRTTARASRPRDYQRLQYERASPTSTGARADAPRGAHRR